MSAKKSSKSKRKPKQGARKNAPVKKANVQSTAKRTVNTEKISPEEKKSPPPPVKKETIETQLPFGRQNYILLLIGVGIIILGFILMSLDDFVDATKFSISLYIAPIVVVAGFIEIIYAIMYRPKQQMTTQTTSK